MKKVGTALYVHKSALDQLKFRISNSDEIRLANILYWANKYGLQYEIIKIDRQKVSLIDSHNWNTAFEPDVGISYCFDMNTPTEYKVIKPSGKIYHCKELFVNPNYTGFDVNVAAERTKLWNSIPNLDKRRIGNKTYWVTLLESYGIPHD